MVRQESLERAEGLVAIAAKKDFDAAVEMIAINLLEDGYDKQEVNSIVCEWVAAILNTRKIGRNQE